MIGDEDMSKKRIPKWLADMATELGKEDNKIIMNNNSCSLRQGLSSVSKPGNDLKPSGEDKTSTQHISSTSPFVPITCKKCKQKQKNNKDNNCWNCGEKLK